jgi:uncharacterized protein (DUF433 family)
VPLAYESGIHDVGSHPATRQPVVKGTRLSEEFILELFAAGWTEEQVFEGYPHLTEEALRAVFAFAAETAREQRVFELRG